MDIYSKGRHAGKEALDFGIIYIFCSSLQNIPGKSQNNYSHTLSLTIYGILWHLQTKTK